MFRKAKSSKEEAKALFEAKHFNGAANRAYYAFYQALIQNFEEDGMSPRLSQGDGELKWKHADVKNNMAKVMNDPDDREVVKLAFDLRVTADYRPDDVYSGDIEFVMSHFDDVLSGLGV